MKNMEIYEPAMCCSTGLCGVGVNTELLRIAVALQNLKDNGINVKRYNLNSSPDAFIQNIEVRAEINNNGIETLPIIVLDGKIVMKNHYPTNDEIANMLGVTMDYLNKRKS